MILVTDIETIPGGERSKPEDIKYPSNYKDLEKIKAYQESHVEDEYRKRALIPHLCKVVSWAVKTDKHEKAMYGNTEDDLITSLDEWLKENTNSPFEITWSGVNIRNFDLVILRQRAWKYSLTYLTQALTTDIHKRIEDIMDIFTGSKTSQYLVSKDVMCQFFGIPVEGDSGSQVYDWYLNKEYDKIKTHCLKDVIKEYQLLKLMSV